MRKKLINKYIKGSETPSDARSTYDHVWLYISDYVRSEGFKLRMDNFLKQHSTNWQLSVLPSYVRPLQPTLKYVDKISGITLDNGRYLHDMSYDTRFTRDMPLKRPSIEFTDYSNNRALARVFAHELGHHIGFNTLIFLSLPGLGKFGDKLYSRPTSFQDIKYSYPDMYKIFLKNKLFLKSYKDGSDDFKDLMLLAPSSKYIDHDARPDESYGDLMELRYLLNENGIYDSRSKEVFLKSHLDKIKSLYPEWRFFLNFDDDDIIEMMNTVAFNGDNNLKNLFKNQDGGKIIDVEGYPLVDSDSEGLTDWFKNNPNVAGMAIGSGLNGIGGERRIVLNPNLKDSNARNSVYMNESYRHFFDANNISLPAVTDVQREAYKGTSYEGLDRKIQETEAARYLSGDPSHHLNAKQKAQLSNFRFTYPGRSLPEVVVEGGDAKELWTMEDEAKYREWRNSLPDNLRLTNDNDYDMRGAFKAGMQPTLESDGLYHLGSRDPETGRILKAPYHPTYLQAINTDARMGYYPMVDDKGQTYTQTWKGNLFADGGIHIKPENRGKFTALKERIGHSATWFKEHGTPAQKKMATFALNARKWKHWLGGNLFDGESQSSQQMEIGRPLWQSQAQEPTFMESLAEFNRQRELKKQQQIAALRQKTKAAGKKLMEERIREASVESNDNAWVETPLTYKKKNPHLSRRAEEGAKAHAAWEKEHPNLTAWGNVAGAVPFAVAATPLGAGIVAGGDALAATTAGQAITSSLAPLYQTATSATIAGAPALAWADAGFTSAFGAHGISQAVEDGGLSPMTTMEIAPLGRLAKPVYESTFNIINSAYNKLPWTYKIPENPNMAYRRMGPLERDWLMEGNELSTRSTNALTEVERDAAVAAEKAANPNRRFVLFKAGAEHGGRKQFAKGQPWGGTTVTHGEEQVLAIPGKDLPWVSGRHFHGPQGNGFGVGDISFEEAPFGSHIDLLTNEGYSGVNPSLLDGSVIYSPYKILDRNFGYKKLYPKITTPQITAENAASMTPEQWTAAQDAAIARGNMDEAQRLRDLHFMIKAPNTVASINGKPLQLYHGTNNDFNAFDLSKYGSTDGGTFGRGVYTTPIQEYAQLYGKNNMSLYMKLDNPRDYRDYSIGDLMAEKLAFGEDFSTGNGIDGVIGRPSWKGFKGLGEYVSHNPKNIKSSKAVTYDDKGVRIPLGLRDNFKINDIRYVLFPFLFGGASALSSKKNK